MANIINLRLRRPRRNVLRPLWVPPHTHTVAWALSTGPYPLSLEDRVSGGCLHQSAISDDKRLVVDLSGEQRGMLRKASVIAIAGENDCYLQAGCPLWLVVDTLLQVACPFPGAVRPWLEEMVPRAAARHYFRCTREADRVEYLVSGMVLEEGPCVMVQLRMPTQVM